MRDLKIIWFNLAGLKHTHINPILWMQVKSIKCWQSNSIWWTKFCNDIQTKSSSVCSLRLFAMHTSDQIQFYVYYNDMVFTLIKNKNKNINAAVRIEEQRKRAKEMRLRNVIVFSDFHIKMSRFSRGIAIISYGT